MRGCARRSRLSLACAAALMLGTPIAAFAAEGPNLLTDDWQLSLGTFLINTEPTVTVER